MPEKKGGIEAGLLPSPPKEVVAFENRNAVDGVLTGVVETPAPDGALLPPLNILRGTPFPDYSEGDVDIASVREVADLIAMGTLNADKEAFRRMMEIGAAASSRWQAIHNAGTHKLSVERKPPSKLADAAASFVESLSEGREVVSGIELGCGYGHDAIKLCESGAQMLCVDASLSALDGAKVRFHSERLDSKVDLICADYLDVLKLCDDVNFDLVFSFSTLHYFPPLFLKHVIFPMIAKTLNKSHGKLYFAMKLNSSDSAQKTTQYPLLPENPYYPCFDRDDQLFRIYPKTKEEIMALLTESFEVESCNLQEVEGYDRGGEKEAFCFVVAKPKISNPMV